MKVKLFQAFSNGRKNWQAGDEPTVTNELAAKMKEAGVLDKPKPKPKAAPKDEIKHEEDK